MLKKDLLNNSRNNFAYLIDNVDYTSEENVNYKIEVYRRPSPNRGSLIEICKVKVPFGASEKVMNNRIAKLYIN